MYDFAVVALLALATVKLVDFLSDAIPQLRNLLLQGLQVDHDDAVCALRQQGRRGKSNSLRCSIPVTKST